MKRLYEMTGRELREEAEAAEARGDKRRAAECQEQLALLGRIVDAFKAKCSDVVVVDSAMGAAVFTRKQTAEAAKKPTSRIMK